MKKNNKKGFTLVELLAVIVILSVIVLIAMTSVVPKMQEAQKNAFVTEVNKFIQGASTVYTSSSISNDWTDVTVATSGSTTTYTMPLDTLVSRGAIEKSNMSSYSGFIKISVTGGVASYTVKVCDGKFATSSSDTYVANTAVTAASIVSVTTCPTFSA